MSVLEYTAKFNSLGTYASTIMADDTLKLHRFKKDLSSRIQSALVIYKPTKFADMMGVAIRTETDIKGREDEGKNKRLLASQSSPSEQRISDACFNCGKMGHRIADCPEPKNKGRYQILLQSRINQRRISPMLGCSLLLKKRWTTQAMWWQGHLAADCTNEKACNNCRKTGHLARDCTNEPVCNLCNVAGHVARQCPKSGTLGTFGGGFGAGGFGGGFRGGYQDVICRNCNQVGHMSRDCMGALMICHNCGGRGHIAYECPSSRFMDRGFRRY
ncbi:DNA-binding protein HEXBP-like [Zingiber officinale]|uniref:DNA-binding protein HEXBP-like n=1 Tax=Zingiber officinale TaxID=94328 RepID=UPI001C4B67D3|nr:DNA-binding protein HEXBP-like [Zingiber officinale]